MHAKKLKSDFIYLFMRKPGSPIRENILKILSVGGSMYGYEIYKIYKEVYGDVLLRSIYYNLKKALEEGSIEVKRVVGVLGNFTWGPETDRVYYVVKKEVEMSKEEMDGIKRALRTYKKSIKEELRKWIRELSREVKHGDEKTRRKCEKLKAFYLMKFGKYPKILDKWIESLPP